MSFSKFISLVREDLKTYKNDWLRPGFQALAVHRFGNWVKTIHPKILRAPFSLVSKALFIFIRNFYGIELPYSAYVGRRVIIEHQHGIIVHGNSSIGDGCILRQGVTLGVRNTTDFHKAPVLGERVDIGAGAKILGPVVVGSDVKIGANAVVLKNIPSGHTAVGIPARILPRTYNSADFNGILLENVTGALDALEEGASLTEVIRRGTLRS